MRVPQRASKRSQYYLLEEIEKRLMLSAAVSSTIDVPASWEAFPDIALSSTVKPAAGPGGLGGSPTPIGLTPDQIRGAYGVGGIRFGNIVGNGAGQTIGIVDAYDDPNAASDLRAFDAAFGLVDPPSFQKLNELGLPAPLPTTDPAGAGNDTWEGEESLDIEWAHVMAPDASIILFEADDPFGDDLYITAASAARTAGVSVVSMSFSAPEIESELSVDSSFTTPADHEGVTFLAAAGDSGAFEEGTTTIQSVYPASSPNVVAVGGTTLNVNANQYIGESAWGAGQNSGTDPDGGGGGGISLYEPAPEYQRFLDDQSTTFRTYPDVAMEADPNTGVPVYDTFDDDPTTPWFDGTIGGTSLATPLWAGLIAVANQGRVINGFGTLDGRQETLPRIYDMPGADFHDITTGDNGFPAGLGYDLTTGRGSPVANVLVPDLAASYIGFHVFNDTNIDGIQEPGETGASGIVVSLKTPGADGVIGDGDDITVETTTTDSFGLYEFTSVPTGQYYVNFSSADGIAFSPIGTGSVATANSIVNPANGNTGLINVLPTAEDDLVNAGVFQQTIAINDVSVLRPHTGVAPLVFTVTLAPVNVNVTDVPYTTVDGTATVANNDYLPTNGILVFPVGVTQETITVDAVGNLTIENTVQFTVVITPPTGFEPVLPVGGVGTIVNTNFPVATVTGPAPQTRSATQQLSYPFIISLSAVAPFDVLVPYTTVDQSAVQSVDYIQTVGTIDFPAGTTSETVDVPVLPGTNRQLDKTFQFQLTTPTFADSVNLGTPSIATATILTNAEPAINAVDGEVTESLTGLSYLPFEVQVTPSLSSQVTVQYATSDGTAIAGRDYQPESGTLTFIPGRIEQTVYVPVYQQFIAAQDRSLSFTLSNSTSTVLLVDPVATGTIHYVSLAAIPFSESQRAIYNDSLNQRVTVSMKGLGNGNVVFLGSDSTATNAYEILVDNTNADSSVTVSVAHGQQTSLSNLVISSSIGAVNAKTTNIVAAVNTAGITSLNLGYLAGGTVTIGGATSGQSVALNFNRVLNGTITSAIAIKSLTAAAYVNTTGHPIFISAPSVGTVKVKGTFGGTISTSTIQSLSAGQIDGGAILASNSIGTVTAGGIDNSTFFAGVTAGLTTLPTSAADFSNAASVIHTISIKKGGVFSNSLIAGAKVDNVNVGKVGTVVGADDFGVSATVLGKIQAVAGSADQLVRLSDPTVSTTVDNFVVSPI